MVQLDTETRDELIKRFKAVIGSAIDNYADAIFHSIKRNHELQKEKGREYSRLDLSTIVRIRTDGGTFAYHCDIDWGFYSKEHHKAGDGYYDPRQGELFEDVIDITPEESFLISCMPEKDKKRGKNEKNKVQNNSKKRKPHRPDK